MTARKEGLAPDWRQQRWPKGAQVAQRWPERSLEQRFMEKVRVDEATGCWVWEASLSNGYAWFSVDSKPSLGHRVSYELFVGPIPEGMTLDHLCHTRDATCAGGPTCLHRRCVNPEHLEVVTLAENKARGRSLPAQNATKTHCDKGHEYTPANTYVSSQGYRQCKTCHRAHARKRYELHRETILAQQRAGRQRKKAAA